MSVTKTTSPISGKSVKELHEQFEAEIEAEQKTLRGKIKYNIYYPLCRVSNQLKEIPGTIRAFYQRGRRGWADSDAWDIDSYLESFLPEMIRHMKNNGYSYPGEGTDGAETPKQWHKVLEQIAQGFEAGRNMSDIEYKNGRQYRKEWNALKKKQDKGLALFAKYFNHLWD